MSSLTHLSVFRPGQIMIFNSDLHHICLHLHSEANAQLSYLSSGQMSYLSSSQIPTNATNIIFEPHLECICLTSNLFFRPVSCVTNATYRTGTRQLGICLYFNGNFCVAYTKGEDIYSCICHGEQSVCHVVYHRRR